MLCTSVVIERCDPQGNGTGWWLVVGVKHAGETAGAAAERGHVYACWCSTRAPIPCRRWCYATRRVTRCCAGPPEVRTAGPTCGDDLTWLRRRQLRDDRQLRLGRESAFRTVVLGSVDLQGRARGRARARCRHHCPSTLGLRPGDLVPKRAVARHRNEGALRASAPASRARCASSRRRVRLRVAVEALSSPEAEASAPESAHAAGS